VSSWIPRRDFVGVYVELTTGHRLTYFVRLVAHVTATKPAVRTWFSLVLFVASSYRIVLLRRR
jgi:hypothetical protein